MIAEAQNQGVSDIHIECQPGRDKVKIRFRKDGALRPYMELPHTYRAAMIARIMSSQPPFPTIGVIAKQGETPETRLDGPGNECHENWHTG